MRQLNSISKKRLVKFSTAAVLLLAASGVGAAGGVPASGLLDAQQDIHDKASLQRGAKLFVNYCLGCHGLSYMRYQRMADDLGITEQQLRDNLLFTGDKPGSRMVSGGNSELAEEWFGVAPPDLSVTARSRGPDWIYSYLATYYKDDDPVRPYGVNNVVYAGTAMPHVLWSLQGIPQYVHAEVDGEVTSEHVERLEAQGDRILVHKAVHVAAEEGGGDHGETRHVTDEIVVAQAGAMSPGEYRQAARDITNFLYYAAEPAKLIRTSLGVWVLGFIAVLFVLTRMVYKEYWKDIH